MSGPIPSNRASREVRIARLSDPIALAEMRELVALDVALVRELGVRFSTERWAEEQFARPLPGKQLFSRVAYSAEHSLVAYWVASLRAPRHLHTHRVGVEVAARGSGVGTALYSAVATAAVAKRISTLTLAVHENNEAAKRFYASLGFTPLVGESLEGFVRQKAGSRIGGNRDRLLVDRMRFVVLQVEPMGGMR